jgi:hypothetical protein
MAETVADHFAGYFEGSYDGQQSDDRARAEFVRLTNSYIVWTQVHGDFKDKAKAAVFVPYPHWRELYECCGMAVREWSKDKYEYFQGDITCARIMDTAMKILRMKYGLNTPKWWIPLMRTLRGEKQPQKSGKWNPGI